MKVKVKGYDNLVALTGSLLDVPLGSLLLVDGDWRVDPKYGQQFVAQSWAKIIPDTLYFPRRVVSVSSASGYPTI